ncbi:MAG: MFS transporter [Sinimarinibacterium flocculans]|uniref:MFS transporter n=1 Tax=Sinimarinibacterium flocculans TaxID=985250 RepID=UPI003C44F0F7
MTTAEAAEARTSAWAPLRLPVFRSLWLAILAGNIGTWIHDTAAAWIMAEMTASPLMVAAVQSATTVPVVLFALLAGTLADIVDRRRYLLLAQGWMFAVATLLAVLAQRDLLGPSVLLGLTFALGIGAAMTMPAQNALTPELVTRPLLPAAVALGSLSMNIARAVGPAIGGLIVAQLGASWAFGINALSFLCIIVVLWRWRRAAPESALPPEHFSGALRAGLRYAVQAPVLQGVLVRAAAFLFFASALAALLPLVVRTRLDGSAGLFGILLGAVGAGAIAGAVLMPMMRARMDRDRMVMLATLGYACCIALTAALRDWMLLAPVMILAGLCWICVLSSLQVASQLAVPTWVRARALSLYIIVFSGSIASGALAWGVLAQATSIPVALLVAACGALLALAAVRRIRLGAAEALDVTPSAHWPQPIVVNGLHRDRGPVLVTLEYAVTAETREHFLRLMAQLGSSRRRDGALSWGVFEDTAAPGTYIETFTTGSWLEHLRQHERVNHDDRRLQEQIAALQREPGLPRIRHFVGGPPRPVPPPTRATDAH